MWLADGVITLVSSLPPRLFDWLPLKAVPDRCGIRGTIVPIPPDHGFPLTRHRIAHLSLLRWNQLWLLDPVD